MTCLNLSCNSYESKYFYPCLSDFDRFLACKDKTEKFNPSIFTKKEVHVTIIYRSSVGFSVFIFRVLGGRLRVSRQKWVT